MSIVSGNAVLGDADMASFLSALRRLLHFLGLGGQEPASQAAPAHPTPAPATPPPPAARGAEPPVGGARPGPTPTVLAMPQLVALSGQFPTRGDGGTNAYFTLAMVQTFAGFLPAYGALHAEGQVLALNNPPSNQALFSVLATSFGGNGMTSFGIPNLNGRAAIGGGAVGMFGQGTLTMTWLISTGPSSLAPVPGTLALFGGNYAPDGWAICDGTMLPISQYVPLYEAIGCAFGGNNASVFALPNLAGGAAPVGAGQGPGRPPVAIGQQVPGTPPGLGVNYLISTEGPCPPSSGPGAFPDTGQYLGQVIAYGGAQVPAGWALCDGSLLPVSANPPLFELIGTAYGGDGKTNFALPDLRGRMMTGTAG
jgi:microcystin-dependent protein